MVRPSSGEATSSPRGLACADAAAPGNWREIVEGDEGRHVRLRGVGPEVEAGRRTGGGGRVGGQWLRCGGTDLREREGESEDESDVPGATA